MTGFVNDDQRKAVMAQIKPNGVVSQFIKHGSVAVKNTGLKNKMLQEPNNSEYKILQEKVGPHDVDFSLEGKRVILMKDHGKHKAGDKGTVSTVTKYGQVPADMTVYFDDGILDESIPMEDGIIADLDAPPRKHQSVFGYEGGAIVRDGKEVKLGYEYNSSRPDHNDLDDRDMETPSYDDRIASLVDKQTFIQYHSSLNPKFFDEVQNMIGDSFWTSVDVGYGKKAPPKWHTDDDGIGFELGGLSNNTLYAPNGGIEVVVDKDGIFVTGHHDETERSHAKRFPLSKHEDALKFIAKIKDDLNNLTLIKYP